MLDMLLKTIHFCRWLKSIYTEPLSTDNWDSLRPRLSIISLSIWRVTLNRMQRFYFKFSCWIRFIKQSYSKWQRQAGWTDLMHLVTLFQVITHIQGSSSIAHHKSISDNTIKMVTMHSTFMWFFWITKKTEKQLFIIRSNPILVKCATCFKLPM